MGHADLSRRSLLAAALPAGLTRAQKSANDRINIGVIGAGGRGGALMAEVEKCRDLNVAVTAVCDVWRPNREKAAARAAKTWGEQPRQTVDYQELLSWNSVDAVLIATPDFAHSRMLKHAVEAGKDAYCEKPMGVDFGEAKAAYLAVKASKQVAQMGTQRRSDGQHIAAARLLRSGVLGTVTRVDIAVNFFEPRWARDYADVADADVSWNYVKMNDPRRRADPRRLRQWQLFRDYTNGIPGLWMSHFSDLVPWFLGDPYPSGAVANGGVFLWKDGRETCDVFQAVLDYPKGFLFSFAMSLTNSEGNRNLWLGSRGSLDLDAFTISGKGSGAPDRLAEEIRLEPDEVNSHMANFIECVRSRQSPRADVQAGFSHAVAGCMAAVARDAGRKVRFDADRLEMI
ncbi:MAG: Gfo/Idh/MocA family oxidoreductase [Bryobacteraceae bacterium]|nr:Gfo/Idh/MocA family oxidoreductase [Bryobacteraceae bacterium]